jgi:hypothetical protein
MKRQSLCCFKSASATQHQQRCHLFIMVNVIVSAFIYSIFVGDGNVFSMGWYSGHLQLAAGFVMLVSSGWV